MPTSQMPIFKSVYIGPVLFWLGRGETEAWEKC